MFHLHECIHVCFACLQVFSLSVTEVGNLVSLGARESCEFFHDPFKGKRYLLFTLTKVDMGSGDELSCKL